MKVLGHQFFTGTLSEAIELAHQGGLVLAPSGPGMADDLVRTPGYAQSLQAADLLLPDSGAMVLLANWLVRSGRRVPLRRLSGLAFLEAFLRDERTQAARSFWIMPTPALSDKYLGWLHANGFAEIGPEAVHIAPFFRPGEPLVDHAAVAKIEAQRPSIIFVNVGGGVQEPLGAWLKSVLSYRPTIICTGAAIAFLSGQQVHIPKWADRVYFGWLFRIISSPSKFLPRYLRALRLVWLMVKYRDQAPPAQCQPVG